MLQKHSKIQCFLMIFEVSRDLCWSSLGYIGPSWGYVGAMLAYLGACWGQVGLCWGDVGPSWSQVGSMLGPCWGHVGAMLHQMEHCGLPDGKNRGGVRVIDPLLGPTQLKNY